MGARCMHDVHYTPTRITPSSCFPRGKRDRIYCFMSQLRRSRLKRDPDQVPEMNLCSIYSNYETKQAESHTCIEKRDGKEDRYASTMI